MTGHRFFPHGSRGWLLVLAGIVGFSLARPAHAQSAGQGFLFQEPRWTLAVRGGFERATAGSDLFDFTTQNLTLSRGDFSGFSVGGDLAYSIKPRVDVVVSGGYAGTTQQSEARHCIGSDDLPIVQSTEFVRAPLTATVKAFLRPRGTSIGSLAWVPSRLSLYVGAGGGVTKYRFAQKGEFVDAPEGGINEPADCDGRDILPFSLSSSGWAPTVHGLGGMEVALTPRLGLDMQMKYAWAKGELNESDFSGFDPIDLSGLSVTVGLHVRF